MKWVFRTRPWRKIYRGEPILSTQKCKDLYLIGDSYFLDPNKVPMGIHRMIASQILRMLSLRYPLASSPSGACSSSALRAATNNRASQGNTQQLFATPPVLFLSAPLSG